MSGPEPGATPTPETPPPAAPPPPTDWASASAPPAATPGPAGLVYADVPNRIIAQIIDAIIVGIVGLVLSLILYSIVGAPTTVTTTPDTSQILGVRIDTTTNWVSVLLSAVLGTALSAGYYIYTWTAMRGTIGQRALGMQVGNAADGKTLTMEQAVKRWLALGGVFSLAQFLNPLPGLGILIGLASLVWVIALLVTTAQSPTKQGLHDRFAGSVVVKAARSVG
ncbi:MAG: RDD family protein [Chloroflexota bacterium]|nr:RDD family protein [Chloroflexota bacterium]